MSRASLSDKQKKSVDNTGFSPNSAAEGRRLVNRDGSTNLRKMGLPFYERISIYHSLLRMSRVTFILTVFAIYTSLNILFASIYFFLGADSLAGSQSATSVLERYLQAFFFSSQTLTTVGYGHISPVGFVTNVVASIESFIGIMSFALVTGIFYARFSRPQAYIRFSHNVLIAPYKRGKALMFRLATYKNNHLTNAEAEVTAAVHLTENGKTQTKFYQLTLEMNKINSMAISWTIVHPLDDNSPFSGFTDQDFFEGKLELMVSIRAFDDHFSNTVQQRTSYTQQEMIFGARFLPMYERSENGQYTHVMLNKINDYEVVNFDA
ncbi:Inward rectifier potassium channel Kirbac3.1 [Dyadobacter sp. CECT 9275]|uniref:Inward rectifier potassium channel Kirbac3.1 n=1 Tax=Dyadobacter helix TaxID=2822344 RepID=A0A916JD23_9BACT|nr:ion channel [Dyadobacter sp. CECT 9275]CAG5003489.1 Inward rectifier potassium channel Kirbac3.1 [Dyadobacter sp. CECT 9275]